MNKEDKNKAQDFSFELEPILTYIGPKGKWQYLQSFCLFLFGVSAGMSVVSYAFPGYVPNYRCIIPICETINSTTFNSKFNLSKDHIMEKSCQRIVPKLPYQNCEQYLELLK